MRPIHVLALNFNPAAPEEKESSLMRRHQRSRPKQVQWVQWVNIYDSECDRKMVCLQCSLFFSRRFCCRCVKKYKSEFPKELDKEITKLLNHYSEVKRAREAKKIENCSK